MSRKKGTKTITVSVREYVDVDAEADIEDLSDEELKSCIAEARKRGLLGAEPEPIRDKLAAAMHDLMCSRIPHAIDAIESAVFADREDLMDAWQAAKAGRINDAICFLDKILQPVVLPDTPSWHRSAPSVTA